MGEFRPELHIYYYIGRPGGFQNSPAPRSKRTGRTLRGKGQTRNTNRSKIDEAELFRAVVKTIVAAVRNFTAMSESAGSGECPV